MTTSEFRESGLSKLSESEAAALDRWLNRYTYRVFSATRGADQTRVAPAPPSSNVYTGTAWGHWVDKVSGNGKYVTLEDGTLWEIAQINQIYTALWLPVTDITIRSADGVAGFTYELIKTDDGEKAAAKFLGRP